MENTNDKVIKISSHYALFPDKKLGSGAFGEIFYGIYLM